MNIPFEETSTPVNPGAATRNSSLANAKAVRKTNGQRDRVGIKPLGVCTSSDSTGVFPTGMLGNSDRLTLGTSGIEFADVLSKRGAILRVDLRITFGSPLARACASLGICETLLFGSGERAFLNQQPLPLISTASATKANNDCLQVRVSASTASQRCVAAGQKHEMGEIRAGHAEGLLAFQAEQPAAAELISTV